MSQSEYLVTVIEVIKHPIGIVTTIVVLIYLYYAYLFYKNSRPGIRGPTPLPIFGNLLPLLKGKRSDLEIEWRKKYGKVYMTYVGGYTRLTIADPEIITEIGIKNSSKFQDLANVAPFSKFQANSIFVLRGERWRKVRTLLTPSFTSGKIKKMFKLLDTTANDFVDMLTNHVKYQNKQVSKSNEVKNLEIDSEKTFLYYSTDGISTCGYGIKLNTKDEYERKNGILQESGKVEQPTKKNQKTMYNLLDEILASFSAIQQVLPLFVSKHILMQFSAFKDQENRFTEMIRRIDAVLKSRVGREHEYHDLLSSIHAAKLNEKLDILETDANEAHHGAENLEGSALAEYDAICKKVSQEINDQSAGLTDIEFYSNCVVLLMVGANTTSFSLAIIGYTMAFHQEYQERVYQEIKSVAIVDPKTNRVTFEYESLTALPYLDAFLSETLRMFGPVIFSTRICSEDHYIEKYGITIKKDEVVQFAYHSLHYDEDYWQDPYKFDPERFMPGNKEKIKSATYLPFGIGPRKCIGMRFALTETKLALAKLLYDLKFVPAERTSFPPKEARSGFLRKFGDMKLGVQLR